MRQRGEWKKCKIYTPVAVLLPGLLAAAAQAPAYLYTPAQASAQLPGTSYSAPAQLPGGIADTAVYLKGTVHENCKIL